ncbi:glycosyltransferase family 2 protein [Acidisphaera sp. L21]|uniref:glycosyltransferase n=1 Tax=Acidisphaera sp. L21 TaxID=1641851 RepID=UPI00131CE769|nr:glycosyltransferase family 2 protein [Acidisphaera sp. L21]
MILALGIVTLVLAFGPFVLTLLNLHELATPAPTTLPHKISVLIPARNEEANIGPAIAAILSNTGVEIELVVLNDGSTDRTADILREIPDPRLRVISGPALPAGWSGKQHACAILGRAAQHDLLVFVDADVRLAPESLSRMAGFMDRNPVGLASGFPQQAVHTWSEQLLLPLIHFLLVGFLPMPMMRRSPSVALGAGCGQLFIARRAAYDRAGGHGAIRASLHDGLTLPRAFRRAGEMTGLFDATSFATCRMYSSAAELWSGLGKNATEGMAKPVALLAWTALLVGGQILPAILMLAAPSSPAMLALVMGIGMRLLLAARFRQPVLSALVHPVGVAGLLVVQWAALLRMLRGRPATWRGRAYVAQ